MPFDPISYYIAKRALKVEELKEALREVIGDKIWRVLDRNMMGNYLPGCVGVGSPFIIHDPDTLQPQMLFTAWTDLDGEARSVWIADIDENLELRNVRQIATPDLFGVTGLNTATAVWDDYNEEWIFACTAYGAPKTSYGYFIFFDKDWNVKSTQVIDFTFDVQRTFPTPSGPPLSIDLGDGGLGMVPLRNKYMVLTGGFRGLQRSMFFIEDLTQRPLPQPGLGNTDGTYWFRLVPSYRDTAIDVHQLFVYNGMLVMLSEVLHNTDTWHLAVHFGPDKDWSIIRSDVMLGRFMMPVALSWSHNLVHITHLVNNVMLHPHYTTLLGRPLLFFVTAPTWKLYGPRRFAHEIWAVIIDPREAFDPRKNKPLVVSGDKDIYYSPHKFAIPTFGAESATIYVFGVATSGTLTIRESSSPYNLVYGATYVESSEPISAGENKIIWDRPAPFISLGVNVDIGEWMVLLR